MVSLLLYLFENSVKANLLYLTANPSGSPHGSKSLSLCPSFSFPTYDAYSHRGLEFLEAGHTGITYFAGLGISPALEGSEAEDDLSGTRILVSHPCC